MNAKIIYYNPQLVQLKTRFESVRVALQKVQLDESERDSHELAREIELEELRQSMKKYREVEASRSRLAAQVDVSFASVFCLLNSYFRDICI